MSGRITAETRAALKVAFAALEGEASAYGPADAIVFALDDAGLLTGPESAAELARLREAHGDGGLSEQRRFEIAADITEMRAALDSYWVDPLHAAPLLDGYRDAVLAVQAGEVARLKRTVAELMAAPATVYRAAHVHFPLGTYRTRDAAREHCHVAAVADAMLADELRALGVITGWRWCVEGPDPSDDDLEVLFALVDGDEIRTDYAVTPDDLAAAYDPKADA